MNAHFPIAVFVHLWNQIGQFKRIDGLGVLHHGLKGHFFSNFESQWVIVVQIPVPCRKVKPRFDIGDVHRCVGHRPHRSVHLPCRDVGPFDEEFSLHVGLASIGDIDNGEFGEAAGAPRPTVVTPPHGVNQWVVGLNRPGAQGRNDHELVAVQHHGNGCSRQHRA